MADDQVTTDTSGVSRTADGTIADASNQNTNQTSETQTTTTEGNTLLTEGKKPDTKVEEPKDGDKKDAKEGAPEKYEDYKVPDGYTLDPAVKTEADKLFKDLGLSQEGAQRLVDFYTSKTSEAFQAPFEAYKTMTDGWRTESEAHPDLRGKLGPGQEVNVRISKALDGLGDPKLVSDFKALMDLTGAGNNSAFIRVINEFAKKVTEGTHVAGNGPATAGQSSSGQAKGPPSAAQAMYPNLPSSR